MDPITETLISAGPLGAIIVALGIAYWRQGKMLQESQEKRVEDAQKVVEKLLTLNDRWNDTLNQLAGAVNELRASVSRRGDR